MMCICGREDAYIPSHCNFPHCFHCGESLDPLHEECGVTTYDMRIERYGIDPDEVGTVIWGTSRMRHILPALLEELERHAPAKAQEILSSYPEIGEAEGGDDFWVSEVADDALWALEDALNEVAPRGFYFGTHPGDGTDFGFWPDDYWAE